MPEKSRLSSIAKLSFAYILGDVVNKGAFYLLAPFYTRYLSVDEFGILAITSVIQQIGYVVFSFGFIGAAFRFFFIYQTREEQRKFYGTIWLFLMVASGFLSLSCALVGGKYFNNIFAHFPFFPYITLPIITTYLRIGFELIPLQLFRAREQANYYFICSSATAILNATAEISLIIVFKQGVRGVLIGNLITAGIMALVYLFIILNNISFHFSWKYLKEALDYSAPLIPHFIAHWGLSVSNRLVLERNVSIAQVGIFSFGDLFRQGSQMVVGGLNNAIMPIFGRASGDEAEARKIPRITTYYLLGITSMILFLVLFTRELMVILAPAKYYSAEKLIPWLLFGLFMQALYYIPMNAISQTAGVTKSVAWVTLAALFVNVFFNLLMVPRYGIIAAAVNTAVSYFVLFVLVYMMSLKIYPIMYEYSRLAKIALAACTPLVIGLLIRSESIALDMLIKLLVFAIYPVLLIVLKFFTGDEKSKLRKLIHERTWR